MVHVPVSDIDGVADAFGRFASTTGSLDVLVDNAGAVALTKVLAVEWADRGVRINGIGSRYITTDLVAALVAPARSDTATSTGSGHISSRIMLEHLGSGRRPFLMTGASPARLAIQPTLHVRGRHRAAMSDVQGVRSHAQRGLQAVEGEPGVVVEGRMGGAVLE